MSLELPADLEPHLIDGHEWSDPGVYALRLSRPDDLAAAWDRQFDTRPSYWDELTSASGVVYVGAAQNVMARLEDHRDGDVRTAALLEVCAIDALRNVWWFADADRAFERESMLALMLANEYPDLYVHQR